MTIKNRKPVEPITPAQAALLDEKKQEPKPAATWAEEAAAILDLVDGLADRLAAGFEAHGQLVGDELREARGLAAAAGKAVVNLTEQVEQRDKTIVAQADAIKTLTDMIGELTARIGALEAADDGHAKMLKTIDGELAGVRGAVDELAKATATTQEQNADAIGEIGSKLGALDAKIEQHATAIGKTGEMVTGLTGRVDGIDRCLDEAGKTVDAHTQAIDEVAGVAKATARAQVEIGERIGAVDAALAEHATRLDAAIDDLSQTASEADAGIEHKIEQVANQVRENWKGVEEKVGAAVRVADDYADEIRGEIREVVQKAESAAAGLGERVDDVGGIVDKLTKGRAEVLEAMGANKIAIETIGEQVEQQGKRGDELADEIRAVARAQGEAGQEVAAIGEQVEQQARTANDLADNIRALARTQTEEITALEAKVTDAVAGIETTHAHARDALARVTILTEQGPAAFHLDRAGHLIRTSRTGEAVDLGRIVPDAATNGVDAPRLVASKIEDGKLVMTFADASTVSCSIAGLLPAPAAAPVDWTKAGKLSKDDDILAMQVADMKAMRREGASYNKIAEKYGTSTRTVARLIKDQKE